MDNDINREINIEQVEFGIDIDNIEYSIEINPRDTFAIELNEQGPQGARGYTGNGISSYELTSSSGLTDTYTITFTDGNTTTVDVTNGRGITSITGPVSVGNVDTYTINYNDNTTSTFTVTNGIDGVNPTVTVGSTTTGNPGTNASVVNSGTAQDIVLDFTIPRGDKGDPGEDGADGFSPIATVTTTPTGATISITDANGTTTTNITNGTDGSAATIAVGTVTTGLPTDPTSVTNVGTSSAAVFDFTIPKGDTGSTGATGNGIVNTEYISSSGLVDTYHINYTNGNYDSFTVTNGQNGTGSVADVLVNGTSVLDGNIAKVIVPTNNNQLTNGAGYITGITSSDVTTALGYTPEDVLNKVTTLTNASTYTQYPSAKTVYDELLGKQNTLTAGSNITISGSTISATDTTYTAGNNIQINGTTISATDTTYTTMVGATTLTDGVSGLVPAPSAGDEAKVLKGDGTWGETPYRNIGEVITSALPLTDAGLHLLDGSLILGGGVYDDFVNYIAELASDSIGTVGAVINNSGVLSGFSATNYAVLPSEFNVSDGETWEMEFKVTTGSNVSTAQYFIGTSGSSSNSNPIVMGIYNNVLVTYINYTSAGPSTSIVSSVTPQANTSYTIKLEFTGTAYNMYIDGNLEGTISASTPVWTSNIALGVQAGTNGALGTPWLGSIDLNNSYIKINDHAWWTGSSKVLNKFASESAWQSTVASKGICDKFVYDSANNTVRLPKWGTQAYTKASTLSITNASTAPVKGNGKTLGLTNGSSTAGLYGISADNNYHLFNPSAYGTNVGSTPADISSALGKTFGITTDSSKSGIVAVTSSVASGSLTHFPLNCYYYIVIATTTKTEIEVDIDEIATDLNGKADVDGSNMVSSVKNFDGGWVYSNFTVANGASFSESDVDYDLSSELPNDNYTYEVIFSAYATTGNTSGNRVDVAISGLTGMSAVNVIGINTRTNSSLTIYGNCIIPVGTSRKVRVGGISNPNGTYTLYSRGYRRVGTNS